MQNSKVLSVLPVVICGSVILSGVSAVAGDPAKAVAGAALASVASEVCPGYQASAEPDTRLKNAAVTSEDLKPGGKYYLVMLLGVRMMIARSQENKNIFCDFAAQHQADKD